MGGEGANWIGEAPFSRRAHIFQNLGDGTFNHSGLLAMKAAVASGTTMTYKLLYNDAVAMTGGQAHVGNLTVDRMARQVAALGIGRMALVSDDPGRYPSGMDWPAGLTIHHRDELMRVQEELATLPGVTVLIYDQTCAAEKRRRRKRGTYPDPKTRIIINELVCEGCGDCGKQSGCIAIQPVETPFGRKRTIDQSHCNKDFSCLKGFCPALVTVHGAEPRKREGAAEPMRIEALLAGLPEPAIVRADPTWNIIATGIGGTGIVTVGAILGMAAHLEGKGSGIIDMAGLAQKGGAVISHIRLAETPDDIKAIRISAGGADLVLGFDVVVAGSLKTLAAADPGRRTAFLVNTAKVMPGEFTRDPDFALPTDALRTAIEKVAGEALFLDATAIATALLGDAIATNMLMLGLACQRGLLPVSAAALERAIEMNGEAVALNLAAFRWGRILAHSPDAAGLSALDLEPVRESLDELVERRSAFLAGYQGKRLARRYRRLVSHASEAEARAAPGQTRLAEAVAVNLFKLMAYKDEYEVARLFTDGSFARQLAETFEGDTSRIELNLAPPLIARKDPRTGRPRKIAFGPWMLTFMRLLAHGKVLRGTPLDPFGWMAERRTERRLVAEYEALIGDVLTKLDRRNHELAVELLSLAQMIRGYGPVKEASIEATKAREIELRRRFEEGATAWDALPV
jgi:indolepyruvate ferredoxin oxidoreductase